MIRRPEVSDHAEFQAKYIQLVPDDVIPFLENQQSKFTAYINALEDSKLDYAYDEGKWSIREVIMHIADTERVFNYRTLAILRGDTQDLPGFDHNGYVANYNSQHLTKSYLERYFNATRNSSLLLYQGFAAKDWDKRGKMSGYEMCLNAMPFMIAGHLEHHLNILNERY